VDQAVTADTLAIIYAESDPGAKALSPRDVVTRIGSLDAAAFSTNLNAFCRRVSDALASAARVGDSFKLDSFEVTVDITARGELRMIGSVSSELHGGVKLIFTRVPEDGPAA
jgi:hypothetical protein